MLCPRRITAILLAVTLPACTGYQTLADPASDLAASPTHVAEIRLTLRNGERLTLTSPCVFGDSLSGISADGPEVHIAMADLSKVQIPKPRKSGTAAFTDAIVLANSDMWVRRPVSSGCPRARE